MGLRVTTRTRPRRGFPFEFGTTTAAAAAADGLAGPFTMAQLVELIFRVKKMQLVASITHERYIEPPPEEEPFTEAGTTSIDVVLPRMAGGFGAEEVANEVELLFQSAVALSFYNDPTTASFAGSLSTIVKDETGGYWIQLNFFGNGTAAGDGGFSSDTDITGDVLAFDATLTIGGSDITIPALAVAMGVSAASLTITVEEWWPYATTAGAAAWNTTTGAAANGGPGA